MSTEKLIPWGEVGYPTFKRTYSRPTEDGKTEEWPDTVERVVKACNEQLGCNFNEVDQEELRNIMLDLKGTVAGRFLWQLGTKTVDKLGLRPCKTVLLLSSTSPSVRSLGRSKC